MRLERASFLAMAYTRVYLALVGLSFVVFGGWFLLMPLEAAGQLGLEVSGENAAFEMRGVYGGVSLGFALLALTGAALTDYTRHALFAATAYFGGYTLARVFSFASGEFPVGAFLYYAIFEIVMAALAILGLALTNPKPQQD